jgi:transcriptional regulator with XRE-family HTH domain
MPAKKPSQNAFGQRLVTFRQTRGLTQVQLAKATGMTQRAISYYEIEAEFPPAPALAQVLEVSTDELLGIQPATPAGRERPEEQRLWKRFQRMATLPTKDQRAVIRLINSLAGSTAHSHAEAG